MNVAIGTTDGDRGSPLGRVSAMMRAASASRTPAAAASIADQAGNCRSFTGGKEKIIHRVLPGSGRAGTCVLSLTA